MSEVAEHLGVSERESMVGTPAHTDSVKAIKDMTVVELKELLRKAEVDVPSGAKRPALVKLAEEV